MEGGGASSDDELIAFIMENLTKGIVPMELVAPYVPLDGINEAGVSCGICMSYQGKGNTNGSVPTDQTTDRPDLTSTTLRVYYNDDDAVVGEKEGANDFQYVTNFIVTPDYYSDDKYKKGLDRYNEIEALIDPDGNNSEGTSIPRDPIACDQI